MRKHRYPLHDHYALEEDVRVVDRSLDDATVRAVKEMHNRAKPQRSIEHCIAIVTGRSCRCEDCRRGRRSS